MSNRKISELTSLTAVAGDDVLPIVDISETDNSTKNKKITVSELLRSAPDGTAAAPAFSFESDDGNGVFLAGTDTVGISTGGTQRVTVDGSGNVTISGDLTVSGATTTVESTTVTIDDKNIELGSVATPTNTTADGGGITLKGATDKTLKWINSTGCWTFNQPMNFNDHVRIDSSGQIGIGTTSPNHLLDVEKADASIRVNALTGNSTAYLSCQDDTGIAGIYFGDAGSASTGRIQYRNNGDSLAFNTNGGERLRIDSSGNVGIGTSSPSKKLEVSGGSVKTSAGYFFGSTASYLYESANNQVSLRIGSDGPYLEFIDVGSNVAELGNASGELALTAGGAEKVRIKNNGHVGIGTEPAQRLHVSGTGFVAAQITGDSTSETQVRFTANTAARISNQANTALLFDTNASERMRIDTSGRLLVGTSSALDTGGEAVIQLSNTAGARLVLGRNDTSVVAGNGLGGIRFVGNDTTSNTFTTLGEILCQADGTHAAGDNPTRLTFKTTADGASSMTERLRIDSSGRVGIGTVPPSYGSGRVSLDLHSSEATVTHLALTNSTTGSGGASNGFNIIQNGLDTKMLLRESGVMSFSTASTERMRIDSSGDVSVGSTSADGRLHVRKDGTGEILQIWQSDLGTNNRNIRLISPSSDSTTEPFTFSTANSFAVQIDSTERFRINAAGQVGIGTTSPSAVLQTQGSRDYTGTSPGLTSYDVNFRSGTAVLSIGQSNGIPSIQGHGSGTAFNLALAPNAGKVGVGTTSPSTSFHVNGSGDQYITVTSSNTQKAGIQFGSTSDPDAGGIRYAAGDNSFRIRTNNAEAIRIDSAGNVGIGTTSPSRLLEIKSSAPIIRLTESTNTYSEISANSSVLSLKADEGNGAGSTRIDFRVDGSEAMRIDSSGNVGINTTSPALSIGSVSGKVLHAAGAGTTGARFQNTSGTSIEFFAGTDAVINTGTSTNMAFYINGSEKMRLDSSGRVGIGTTSIATRLQIGSSTADSANVITFGKRVTSTQTNLPLIGHTSDGTNSDLGLCATSSGGAIRFFTGNGADGFGAGSNRERARVDSSGRLLVGTTSSSADVRFVVSGKQSNSAAAGALLVQRGQDVSTAGTALGNIFFSDSDGDIACQIEAASDGAWASDDYPGSLRFKTTADGASSPTERMRIDSSGNLGVGSTSPQALLEVRKDSSTAYDSSADSAQRSGTSSICITNHNSSTNSFSQLVFDTAASNQSIARIVAIRTGTSSNDLAFVVEGSNTKREAMRIDSSGRLLVGTTTEGAANADNLTIADSGHAGITIRSGSSSKGAVFFSDATSGSGEYEGVIEYNHSDNNMLLFTSGSEAMRIDSSQRLQIGTTSVTHGTVNLDGSFFLSDLNNNAYGVKVHEESDTVAASGTSSDFFYNEHGGGLCQISVQRTGNYIAQATALYFAVGKGLGGSPTMTQIVGFTNGQNAITAPTINTSTGKFTITNNDSAEVRIVIHYFFNRMR